ncbi:hypothetical protein ACWDG9_17060 [Streptomyces sp. NPDC001073]
MTSSRTTRAAAVTEEDRQAVAWAGDPSDPDSHDKFMRILFGPWIMAGRPLLDPRAHGAVGTLLSYRGHDHDRTENEVELLAVAHAHGRTRRLSSYTVTGAVLLAGEIAARTIHRQLATELGEPAIRPLTCVVDGLWPLPGTTPPDRPHGDLAMNLGRLLGDLPSTVMAHWQHDALKPLINAYHHSLRDPATNPPLMLTVGRSVQHAHRPLGSHMEEFTATRQDILIARTLPEEHEDET